MNTDEMHDKLAAMNAGKAQGNCAGIENSRMRDLDEPARPSLQERVASQLSRATREARNAERLRELQYLLDKNPEVARILDLLDGLDKY